MGCLIQSNNLDVSKEYGREIERNRLLGMIEDW